MGRAHHDGQQLEHLPEMRLGEEHSRATGRRPKKLAVAQFGFEKKLNHIPCYFRVGTEFSPLPSLSSSSLSPPFLLAYHYTRAATHWRRHRPLTSTSTTKDAFQCLVVPVQHLTTCSVPVG